MKRNGLVFPINDKKIAIRLLLNLANCDRIICSTNEYGNIALGIIKQQGVKTATFWFGIRKTLNGKYEFVITTAFYKYLQNSLSGRFDGIRRFVNIFPYGHQDIDMIRVNIQSADIRNDDGGMLLNDGKPYSMIYIARYLGLSTEYAKDYVGLAFSLEGKLESTTSLAESIVQALEDMGEETRDRLLAETIAKHPFVNATALYYYVLAECLKMFADKHK